MAYVIKAHEQRVMEERMELEAKIAKLDAFIDADLFRTLDAAEQLRLHRQLKAMKVYASILGERIAAFRANAGRG